jgi:Ca2+-binding RTX toxin-like protein
MSTDTQEILQKILYINKGYSWCYWGASYGLGNAVEVSYCFATYNPDITTGSENYPENAHGYNADSVFSGFRAFNEAEEQAALAAMAEISSFANIKFNENIGGENTSNIVFTNHDWYQSTESGELSELGWTGSYPVYDYEVGRYVQASSYVSMNTDFLNYPNYWDAGKPGYQGILHEIGHALGLAHVDWVSIMKGGKSDGTFIHYSDDAILALRYLYGKVERGTEGNDVLYGSDYDFKGIGDSERRGDDRLHGLDGKDKILGGAGEDELYGDGGNDSLYGEEGNDWLCGGTGNDCLEGGTEEDTYYFNVGDGVDTVNDTWGTNTFQFGSGINRDMLDVKSTDGVYSLVYDDQGDSIVLGSDLNSHANDIIEFSDGSTMTIGDVVMDDVRAMLLELVSQMLDIFRHA